MWIQNTKFTVDLHLLPLSGANLVLRVQWLKALGPILTDYNTLSMKFFHGGNLVELKGDDASTLSLLSHPQVHRLLRKDGANTYLHIAITTTKPPSNPTIATLPSEIQPLITKFNSLFQPPQSLPPSRPTDHHIHLQPHSEPVNVRPYRYPHFQKHEIERQIKDMLERDLICPSISPFSSPVLLVRKHNGSWRLCVDYRALNAITIKDRYPIPTIDELLDELGGANWFSKLDLLQGYYQIRMHEPDVAITAFRTHHGHYEFKVMSFGFCNAPCSFQATMNDIFQPYLRRFIIVFFDDILIYSQTLSEHLIHLEKAFETLLHNQFILKFSKCSFAQSQVEYLGHVVSGQGVAPIASKIQAIDQWPIPMTTKALCSFLGLAGFYRRFIRGYASIVAPLIKVTTKEPFEWTAEADKAFRVLKTALISAPVLVLPNFTLTFTLETDASGVGMGVVLSQKGHPIVFFSKPFTPKMLQASTYMRELCAITTAVKRWRQYLLGHQFTILTNHRSLKELLTQVIQTPEQQMYLARLMG